MTLDSLERIAFAAVAVTANALADAAGSELTFLGWRALVVLGESPEPIRLSEFAGRLRLSLPSASKLVRRLERRGLVALAPNPEDGRGLLVSLGEEGRRVRHAVLQRRREILRESLAERLPATFEEGLDEVSRRLEPWI